MKTLWEKLTSVKCIAFVVFAIALVSAISIPEFNWLAEYEIQIIAVLTVSGLFTFAFDLLGDICHEIEMQNMHKTFFEN